MSEYQYYEFQAVDRPLTDGEMRELRAVSTRARITPTQFVNVYHWGDFKGSPARWMERYFDAFLYVANWGTRELMLRLPAGALDAAAAEWYCPGDSASAWEHGDFVVLSFTSQEEGGDSWDDDGSEWLSPLLPLRAEIAAGDHRALYLAWLLCAQAGDVDEEEEEPPVPPGLGELSPALRVFADFLRIDPDLVSVAAERSPPAPAAPGADETRRWIASLPDAERVELLARVAGGAEREVRSELLRRIRATRATRPAEDAAPRTARELLEAAERLTDERRRARAEAEARERARREREAAAARERHLDQLAPREEETWEQVDALVASKRPVAYDEAVGLLADLRDLAARDGRTAAFDARLHLLRERHARKPSFLERLRKKIR
jgi:hypothetical protein